MDKVGQGQGLVFEGHVKVNSIRVRTYIDEQCHATAKTVN